jgi:DNA-binding NarL/FixJ family response regulator
VDLLDLLDLLNVSSFRSTLDVHVEPAAGRAGEHGGQVPDRGGSNPTDPGGEVDHNGAQIAAPYRPRPDFAPLGVIGCWQRCRWLPSDPATWRDLLWTLANVPVGLLLGLLPGCLIVYGVEGIVVAPWLWTLTWYGYGAIWPIDDWLTGLLTIPQALVILPLAVAMAPMILRGHALFTRSLLSPTRETELALRVHHLTETRTEALDSSAAELRRIERDLHDGAQARTEIPGLPVLVLSQHVEQLYARELLAGAGGGVGYLLKDRVSDVGQFVDAVRRVADGGTALDPDVVSQLLARHARAEPLQALTPREHELLGLMAEGRSNAAIASRCDDGPSVPAHGRTVPRPPWETRWIRPWRAGPAPGRASAGPAGLRARSVPRHSG